ncbi:M48 family metallopeptidase [Paracoccaceae bacterium GXU_MW_L88]
MTQALLRIGTPPIEVTVHRNARARRITLRLTADGRARVTVPSRMPFKDAERFVAAHEGWLREKMAGRPEIRRPEVGGTQLYLGEEWPIAQAAVRSSVIADGQMILPQSQMLGPAMERLLKREARRIFAARCDHYAEALGRPYKSIRLGDPKSRWGSCSHDGKLMFNWRLIMAPVAVRDYVCAHEVAHLIEMNHSPDFWKIVAKLRPDYKNERNWLKRSGATLLAWEFT